MKKIVFSTVLLLAAATVFATTQTKTTQDKPWRVYLLGATMNTSNDDHAIENDYYYPYDPQPYLSFSSDSQTTSEKAVVWVNGLGGGGSGTALNNSISEGFIYPYTNYDNSFEVDLIVLDLSGVGNEYQSTHKWGSDYGNSYDYPNWWPANWSVTRSSYVANEHCVVADPQPPFWTYGYYTTLGPVLREVTRTGTYQRYAQAVWHVQTGGKAIPGRQNLWQFGGGAQEVLDKRGTPPWTFVPTREITNKTQIALGSLGNLKADGNLWLALPDDQDFDVTPTVAGMDFYKFSVGGQKYTLTITANDNDLSVTNPEFCVGQKVNAKLEWQPALPGSISSRYLWAFGGDYVNAITNEAMLGESPLYVINSDLQTNRETSLWWFNGGKDTVSCDLTISNTNQIVKITAAGSVSIFRPTVTNFVCESPRWFTNDYPNLKYGDRDITGVGGMKWHAEIHSTYNGLFSATQIYHAKYTQHPLHTRLDTTGFNCADSSEWYDYFNNYITNGTSSDHTYRFSDFPACPYQAPFLGAEINVTSADDYIRFKPGLGGNDGNIFVTLGVVHWHAHGNYYSIGGWSANDTPAASAPDGSIQFPEWTGVLEGGDDEGD